MLLKPSIVPKNLHELCLIYDCQTRRYAKKMLLEISIMFFSGNFIDLVFYI